MYIDPIQSRIDSNELNHHGVLGMKWGVRKQPKYAPHPRKAKKIQKDIRVAEYKAFDKITNYNNLHDYGMRLNKKVTARLVKDSQKGKISNRTLRKQDKLTKVQNKLDSMKSDVFKYESKINDLVKEAQVGGYKVDNIKRKITISQYPMFYTYDIDSFKISNKK